MAISTDIHRNPLRATAVSSNTVVKRALIILSIGLVISGQVILLKTAPDSQSEGLMQALAGCLFVAGGLLFGRLAPSALKLARLEFPRRFVNQPASLWGNCWMQAWVVVAIIFAAAAVGLFATHGESSTVVLIWLIGILALFVAQLPNIHIRRPVIAPNERLYVAVLAVLLLVTLLTRTYNLTILPYNVDADFADVGLLARALATSPEPHIFALDQWSMPMVGYIPEALSMIVFGTGLAGLNASGVVEGLLILIGVYLLGRDLFNARVGLFAAALLTISETHLAASRQSYYIDIAVFVLFAVYLLLIGLREGRGWAMVASGVLTTLCIQSETSGRIIVFVVVFILLYMLIFRRAWLWARKQIIGLWVLAMFITLGPMLVLILRDPIKLMWRTNGVFILSPAVVDHMKIVDQVNTIPALLLEQARHTMLLFNYYTDTSSHYALQQPFLDPFAGVLFILGVGYALVRWRWLSYMSILGWIVLVVVFGCFLTSDPPWWPRLIALLPATALLAAEALNQLYELAKRGLTHLDYRAALIAPLTVTLLMIGVGVQNWNKYVEVKGTWATPLTRMARYLADQPPETHGYLVSTYFGYYTREFPFLAPGRLVANLSPEQALGDIARVGTPTLLILTWEQSALVEQLKQKMPDVQVETHFGNMPSEIVFYVFRLP